MNPWYWLVPVALLGLVLFYWIGRSTRLAPSHSDAVRKAFASQRTELHAAFFRAVSASGKPRGLRWKECQWNDLIEWVREKESGQLLALVGVTISFEAIEGGDMEGVEAVSNLRNASAVFFLHEGEWRTGGRVIYNLNPSEAVEHFKDHYERIV